MKYLETTTPIPNHSSGPNPLAKSLEKSPGETIVRVTILANVEGRTPRVDRHLMSTGAVAQRRKVHLTALGWLSIRVGLHAAAQLFPYLMEARLRGAQLYSRQHAPFTGR